MASPDDPNHEGAPEQQTIARPRLELPAGAGVSFNLSVIEGPDAGQSFSVDGAQPSRILLGQSPACALRLSDRSVSRRHAALDVVDRRLRLTDLGSTNGTQVDGLAVLDVFLRGGEIIRVGSTALKVTVGGLKLPPKINAAERFGRVVGASPEMRRLYPLCERLAAASVPVLIEGETGTGKEAMAEALHEVSPRASGPFVVFDCTAVPSNLLESELFGHEKGAFTGAVSARKGVFEQADKGTLLIDEIGDLESSLQPKLLRVIERSEIRRVGGAKTLKVDVRLLFATRRDLDREVQAGRFRDDLFHRIAVARVELPPLRSRRNDIPLLARSFWQAMGGDPADLPGELLQRWQDAPWPGNVRELRNAVARRLALGDLADSVPAPRAVQALPTSGDSLDQIIADKLPFPVARQRAIDEFERRYISAVLDAHGGNVVRAAAASGIARRYFQIIKARQSGPQSSAGQPFESEG